VIIAISANVVALCFYEYPTDMDLENVTWALNLGFTSILIIEMTIKILANGLKFYFSSFYHLFDVTSIVLSVAEIIVYYFMDYNIYPILRSMRIFRMIKLVKIFS
jgi:hypothetical protein